MATTSGTPSLASLAQKYADLRAEREKLEAMAKKIREQEDEAKARLISEMDVQKIPSIKFDGIGRVVLRANKRYEIQDTELFVRAMLQRIVDNGQHGRPLSDGLMLQKRPAKTVIEELAGVEHWDMEKVLPGMGLTVSENMDITFTRDKVVGNE